MSLSSEPIKLKLKHTYVHTAAAGITFCFARRCRCYKHSILVKLLSDDANYIKKSTLLLLPTYIMKDSIG